MATLTRQALLGATTVPTLTVEIPELGGSVIVRGMTGAERDKFESSCWEGRGKKRNFSMSNIRAKLVTYCVVDETGHRLFTEADVDAIGAMRADIVDRLFGAAQKLSGMSEEDIDELGRRSENPTVSATSSTA